MTMISDPSLDEDLADVLDRAAATFAILGSPARLRILQAVCDGERAVAEIVRLTGLSQTNVSQHLALMLRGGLLKRRRDGSHHFYSVADADIVAVCRVVCTKVAAEGRGPRPAASRRSVE